jgi:hypothetical protein
MGINRIREIFFDGYWGHYTRIKKIILISLLITSLHSFVVSLGDTKQYAGIDLRNKVVGARYLLAGLDPYAIEQNPPSEWFLDPQRHYPGYSRTTVTPLVLMAYCPFAWLPYSTQRTIWVLIEWFTMILCILVLMRIVPKGKAGFVFLVFALLFFVSGYFWRLHVERGQYYILLTLILSLAIFFDTKQKSLISTILLGLLAILRPTFLIIIPLLLLLRSWKKAGVMALASLAIFALSLIGSNIQVWNSYFTNIYFIQRGFANKQYSEAKSERHNITPNSAEGVNFNNMIHPPWLPLSSLEVLKQFSKRIHNIPPVLIWQLNKFAGVCFLVYCFCMAFLIGKYSFNQRFLWIFIIAIVLSVDYFSPERWAYNDILFLPAIALLAPLLVSPFISMTFALATTCAFLLSYDHTLSLFGFLVANVVRSVLFMSALNIFIISCVFKKMQRSLR